MKGSSTGIQLALDVSYRVDAGAAHRLARLLFGSIELDDMDGIGATSSTSHMMADMWDQPDSTGFMGVST
jgi:hypothetical protein